MTSSGSRVVRAALTETRNAFDGLPEHVADLQLLSGRMGEVRDANLAHHIALARKAKAAGADVICFGEVFTGPYFALSHHPVWLELAETIPGPTTRALSEVAAELEMVIVAPLYELDLESDLRFNTAAIIDANGELLGTYTKSHIPHGANEKNVFQEGFYFHLSTGRPQPTPKNISRNNFFPVFETRAGRIGVAICYDRHFEGVMSTLKAEGAELVFSPAVTFGKKSERMWRREFEVDAARHRLIIGGSNRKGKEPPWNQEYFGDSHFVGPDGVLENLSSDPELIIADCDLGMIENPDPSGWRLIEDRRNEIYSRPK